MRPMRTLLLLSVLTFGVIPSSFAEDFGNYIRTSKDLHLVNQSPDLLQEKRTGEKLGDGAEFEISWTTNEAAMLSLKR